MSDQTERLQKRAEKYFDTYGWPENLDMKELLSDLDPTLTKDELEDELASRGVYLERLDKRTRLEEFGIDSGEVADVKERERKRRLKLRPFVPLKRFVTRVQYVRPLPRALHFEIRPIRAGYRALDSVGFDTETVHEDFYSFQSFDMNGGAIFYDRISGLRAICQHEIAYAFNLEFDLFNLIPPPFRKYALMSEPFQLGGFVICVRYGKPLTATIIDTEEKTKTKIRDLMAFFPKHNLAYLGEMIGLSKIEKPPYLGQRGPIDEKEKEYFERYAIRDAEIVFRNVSYLSSIMKDQNVSSSAFSIPHLSSLLFRKKFLKENIHISPEFCALAWNSYYGGRAECFDRGEFEKVRLYDFNSMYPYALTQDFPLGSPQSVRRFVDENIGYYYIEGHYTSDLEFGVLPVRQITKAGLNLTFPLGRIRGYYASPEIDLFREFGRIDDARGIVFPRSEPLFKEYIEWVYMKKKREKKATPKYELFKLFMNSFYGKFAQQNEDESAGIMFDPYMASLITSYARRRLAEEMISTEGIHYVNTDSLITDSTLETGSKLGDLSLEARGDFTGIRSRLFLLEGDGEVKKFALHGTNIPLDRARFISDLKRAFVSRERYLTYSVDHMTRVKEAEKRQKRAFAFESKPMKLDLSPDSKRIWPHYFGDSRPLLLD